MPMEFDVSPKEYIAKLQDMLGFGDKPLLGMQEDETLALIEVFDRVSFTVPPAVPLPRS